MLEPTLRCLWENLGYLSTVLQLPAEHLGRWAALLAALVAVTVVAAARRLFR